MPKATCRICGGPTMYGIGRQGEVRCGEPECVVASRLLRNATMCRSPRAPCRVCGELTKYPRARQGAVNCGKPGCRKASRMLWRANISVNTSWRRLNRVSREEKLLSPCLVERGWVPQFKFVPSIVGAPHVYYLDFALPLKKLCVEIDGKAHRHRVTQDRRRDEILIELGWKTLRIATDAVDDDLEGVIASISSWADRFSLIEIAPLPVKRCMVCNVEMVRPSGVRFDRWLKRATCSKECQGRAFSEKMTGRPNRTYRGVAFDPLTVYIPCRICGEPTYRRGTPEHPMYRIMVCDKPNCRVASKELKRQNLRLTMARKRQERESNGVLSCPPPS